MNKSSVTLDFPIDWVSQYTAEWLGDALTSFLVQGRPKHSQSRRKLCHS